ncbi:hypothetical protein TNCV_1378361 [Trichonephila clavipes]|nr:hypothetical protein TNCV_1378361 [Trichonephila clavipes]
MRIVYGRDLCNAALKYGLANEEIARKQYERKYSTEVKICGLFVDKDKPFLCASPDGLVDDELHSDTDTDISSNYLDYSSDDSCSELSSDEDLRVLQEFLPRLM